MKLTVYRHLWGLEGAPLLPQLKRIKEAGYEGVEGMLPPKRTDRRSSRNCATLALVLWGRS